MDSRRHTVNTNSTVPASELRPEDEKLGLGANLAYGLQHVLTMYGGIVAVPLIVAEAAGMSAADAGLLITACLFMGGVATLLQTLGIPFFGSRLPLVQGVSFAGVATMVSILQTGGGLPGILGAVMASAVLGSLGAVPGLKARRTTSVEAVALVATSPVTRSMSAHSMPSGQGNSSRGVVGRATFMKSIQMGRATRPPSAPPR